LDIRRSAAMLHNKRTHNTANSSFVDLVRALQAAAMDNHNREKERYLRTALPGRVPPPWTRLLSVDQIWIATNESAYDPQGHMKNAQSLEQQRQLVCHREGWVPVGWHLWRVRHNSCLDTPQTAPAHLLQFKSIKSLHGELARFVAFTATRGEFLPNTVKAANAKAEVVSAALFKSKMGTAAPEMMMFLDWLAKPDVVLSKRTCADKLDALRTRSFLRQQVAGPNTKQSYVHAAHSMLLAGAFAFQTL
jgi:hypothetical protein